jgi:hypothetical protein
VLASAQNSASFQLSPWRFSVSSKAVSQTFFQQFKADDRDAPVIFRTEMLCYPSSVYLTKQAGADSLLLEINPPRVRCRFVSITTVITAYITASQNILAPSTTCRWHRRGRNRGFAFGPPLWDGMRPMAHAQLCTPQHRSEQQDVSNPGPTTLLGEPTPV